MNARTQETIRNKIMSLKSIDELQDVHYVLKLRWNQLKQLGALSFNKGDRVNICHEKGRFAGHKDAGTVEKVNRTTILVRADSGMKWRCSPSVLEKL